MKTTIETDREDDGRWIAEVPSLPGVMAYGSTVTEVIFRAQTLALRAVAERLELGEAGTEYLTIALKAA